MDEQTYNELPGERFSRLKAMGESPRAYYEQTNADSDAFLLGRAYHCAVLEPNRYRECYAERPADLDGRTKDGKAWLAAQRDAGREVLSAEDSLTVQRMAENTLADPVVAALLRDAAHVEHVVTWIDSATGIACKCKADLVTKSGALVDLKSTRHKSLRKLRSTIAELSYHAQLGFYSAGMFNVRECIIVFCQSVPPFDVVPMRLSGEEIAVGRALACSWLEKLDRCQSSNKWPGLSGGELLDAELPQWAMGGDDSLADWKVAS